MIHKEIELSEERFDKLIEATEKHCGKLSKEQKAEMRQNYFNKNKGYKI